MNEQRRTIPIACTLEPSDLPARLAQWQSLVAEAVGRDEVDGGVRLRFAAAPGLAARIAALAEAEQGCCGFFDFTVALGPDGVSLTVAAPAEARSMVDGLLGGGRGRGGGTDDS
jgi:hypothetical protein